MLRYVLKVDCDRNPQFFIALTGVPKGKRKWVIQNSSKEAQGKGTWTEDMKVTEDRTASGD